MQNRCCNHIQNIQTASEISNAKSGKKTNDILSINYYSLYMNTSEMSHIYITMIDYLIKTTI